MADNTRSALIKYNRTTAGRLSKSSTGYVFTYDTEYLRISGSRPVSVTLPLREEPYQSKLLFPVFINMLSEGANKSMQCRMLKIDENDYFGLLLATGADSVGPISIQPINEQA